MKLYERYEGKKLQIAEKIQQRRLQMLVHSYIYYELDKNIVSDSKWSEWAKELQKLQEKYPNMSRKIPYAEQFQDWDGSTGAYLQYDDHIKEVAEILLRPKKVMKKPSKVKQKKGKSLF